MYIMLIHSTHRDANPIRSRVCYRQNKLFKIFKRYVCGIKIDDSHDATAFCGEKLVNDDEERRWMNE